MMHFYQRHTKFTQKELNFFYRLIPPRFYQESRKVSPWMLRVLHCGGISNEKPRDFETFLTNDANKKLLLEVLLKV